MSGRSGGPERPPPIYVVSGGTGASGEQVVHTVLVQFPGNDVSVITVAHVCQIAQVEDVLAQAAETGGTIVHTLVDPDLRGTLVVGARQRAIAAIDLMGPLISRLTDVFGREPVAHPGLYHELHQAYFDRVAAIEYSMAHDDGRNSEAWPQADVVIIGVSRVGKTPLSMYLSVLGWRVANVPLVLGLPTPTGLFRLDPRRVIGLYMDPAQLLFHRRQRQLRLHAPGLQAYTDPAVIEEELAEARRVFRQGGFTTLDVTDKPIEVSADQVIELITRRFGDRAHLRSAF
jgi:regulator of PEP synthase PpsR (kinase-PPPase family)